MDLPDAGVKHQNSSISKFNAGTTIYLQPGKDLNVRAIENCKVVEVLDEGDSKIILTEGNLQAGYGNLKESFVVKGQIVKRGQIIGRLDLKDSVADNSLSIYLEKDGKPLMLKW